MDKLRYYIAMLTMLCVPLCCLSVEYQWTFSVLSDGSYLGDRHPSLYGGSVVWVADGSIQYWDGSTVVQLGDPSGTYAWPSLYDGRITWTSNNADGTSGIYYWDGATAQAISDTTYNDNVSSLWDGEAAWHRFYVGEWRSDLFYWDGNDVTQLTNGEYHDGPPDLANGRMAWARRDPGYIDPTGEIWFWDGETISRINDSTENQGSPSVWGEYVAFHQGSGSESKIMLWNGSSVEQICTYEQFRLTAEVVLWDGMIAWVGYDGTDTEIYLWDGAEVHQVTNDELWQFQPDLYSDGNQIQLAYKQTGPESWSVDSDVVYATATIPEPSTALLSFSCFGLALLKMRRRK